MLRIIIILFFGYALSGHAQKKEEELSSFVRTSMENLEIIPGISVAVVGKDGLLYSAGFGLADIETGVKATSKTNFYIASSTKAFNGLLMTLLEGEGKVDLDAEILNYRPFSEFEKQDLFAGVTVQDLLSHTSGVDNPFLSFKLAYTGDYTEDGIIELVETASEKNEEGKVFNYTNYGYYLIAILLKEEWGRDWRVLLDQRIFSPLGMDDATAYVSQSTRRASPHSGFFKDDVQVVPFKTDETMHAAGGLLLNADDAARFLSQFIGEGHVKGERIVSADVIKRAITPVVEQNDDGDRMFSRESYANGWNIGEYEGERVIFHFGGYTGFASHMSFMPDNDLGVAVFVNHDIGMPIANEIAAYAYDLYGNHPERLDDHLKEVQKELPKMLSQVRKRHERHLEKLASREWDLKLPRDAYKGVFHNEKIGTMEVFPSEESFEVSCGNMRTIATPYPAPNCLRVEMTPGRGTIIQFLPHEGEADTLNWNGELFVRSR